MSNIDPRNPPWNPYEKVGCLVQVPMPPYLWMALSILSWKTQKLIIFLEQLELLAEILKAANVAPEALLPIVRSLNHQPHWHDVVLPRGRQMRRIGNSSAFCSPFIGRTLRQSQDVYYQLVQSQPPHRLESIGAVGLRETPRPVESQLGKRPYTSEGPSSTTGLATQFPAIQPKPPGLPTTGGVNERSPGEPPKKKRGRPPKAQTEARREEARARGEQYEPPKRSSVPNLAVSGATSAMARANPAWPNPQTRPTSQGPGNVSASAPSRPLSQVQPLTSARTTPPADTKPSSDPGSSGRKRRARQRAEFTSRASEEEGLQMAALGPHLTPSRAYPDILSRDPEEGPSTFRAPRGQ